MSPISSRNSVPRCATSSRPGLAATAPVNAPFSWPNSSALQQLPGERRAVEVDERLVGARPVAVQPAREHALARAGLALDEHRAVRGRHAARLLGQPTHRGARAQEGIDRAPRVAGLAGQRPLPVALLVEQPLDHDRQRAQLDRLGEEVLGALLDRLHREVDRAVAGQHDQRHRRVERAQPRQQVERVAVGQRSSRARPRPAARHWNDSRGRAQAVRLVRPRTRAARSTRAGRSGPRGRRPPRAACRLAIRPRPAA